MTMSALINALQLLFELKDQKIHLDLAKVFFFFFFFFIEHYLNFEMSCAGRWLADIGIWNSHNKVWEGFVKHAQTKHVHIWVKPT